MSDEMKLFLTELAELLEKHDVEISHDFDSMSFCRETGSHKMADLYENLSVDGFEITHETIKELLK
jgi:hypothetical protein